jgi:hypothetical protein
MAGEQIIRLYRDWKILTLKEKAAICAEQWPLLQDLQSAKAILKEAIVAKSGGILAEETLGQQSRFKEILQDLVELEQENATLLSLHRRSAQRERIHFQKHRRTLGQLRHSYTWTQGPSFASYS